MVLSAAVGLAKRATPINSRVASKALKVLDGIMLNLMTERPNFCTLRGCVDRKSSVVRELMNLGPQEQNVNVHFLDFCYSANVAEPFSFTASCCVPVISARSVCRLLGRPCSLSPLFLGV